MCQTRLFAVGWGQSRKGGYSPRCSSTILTARSRTSGENLFVFFMAQSSQSVEPPLNPGRFITSAFNSAALLRDLEIAGLQARIGELQKRVDFLAVMGVPQDLIAHRSAALSRWNVIKARSVGTAHPGWEHPRLDAGAGLVCWPASRGPDSGGGQAAVPGSHGRIRGLPSRAPARVMAEMAQAYAHWRLFCQWQNGLSVTRRKTAM